MSIVDYSEQEQISDLTVPDGATIVGAGGSGTWIAVFLAMAGSKNLTIFDGAVLKPTDIARLPYPPTSVGRPKVEALVELLRQLRPGCAVKPFARHFDPATDSGELYHTVFNAADSDQVARDLADFCGKNGRRFFCGFYNGMAAAVVTGMPSGVNFSGRPAPCWVGSAAMAASLAVTSAVSAAPFQTIVAPTAVNLSDDEFSRRKAKLMSPMRDAL